MPGSGHPICRRSVMRGLGLLGGLAVLPGCAADFGDTELRVATGARDSASFAVGSALARIWQRELGLGRTPEVITTMGSTDNVRLLDAGTAGVAFCQVDVAADRAACCPPDDPSSPRALARIYDDVLQIVVPAASTIRTIHQLPGTRVSVGDPGSGVSFVADRLLASANLTSTPALERVELGIAESLTALADGRIDAFFWAGPLPTQGVSVLAAQLPIRLLDLGDVVRPLQTAHPEYATSTIPAGSYGIPQPVTSLGVRNVLLVKAQMSDALAEAMVEALFSTQQELARASRATLTINPRSAIGTQPLPLHPGAERFYRRADSF
jgi:TRAP transporter TAXI family solute receptor